MLTWCHRAFVGKASNVKFLPKQCVPRGIIQWEPVSHCKHSVSQPITMRVLWFLIAHQVYISIVWLGTYAKVEPQKQLLR